MREKGKLKRGRKKARAGESKVRFRLPNMLPESTGYIVKYMKLEW